MVTLLCHIKKPAKQTAYSMVWGLQPSAHAQKMMENVDLITNVMQVKPFKDIHVYHKQR